MFKPKNITDRSRWSEGLDCTARRIAEIDHTPLRVLEGPGTGKTFSLIRRAARLLEEGVAANRILVCTFTRTAAGDLHKELLKLGVKSANKVRAGTIHSYCFGLLSKVEVLQITERVPRPLLKFEERFLLEDLKGENFGGIRDREKRLQAFNSAWARLQTDDPGWPNNPIDHAFHRALIGWLSFHEAMLVGELLPETLRHLRENPASPDRNAFDHVLVDEYQDLNRAEQVLLDVLSEAGTLTVIGDEDQSIYSFKHAHPDGISTFHLTHPGTHDEALEECRRCPQLIVDMANKLIAENQSRASRKLCCCNDNQKGELLIIQWRSIEEEAQGIAKFICDRIFKNEVEAGRVLVLAPRRQFGYEIRNALNNMGIPAHSFFHEEALEGNPKKIDESMTQQAFTLLTLLANREDRVGLRSWGGFGSNSLRSGAWERLRSYCEKSGDSPWSAMENLASGDISLPQTKQLVFRFQELQRRLEEIGGIAGARLVDALFPESELWTYLFRSIASTIEIEDFDAIKLLETLRIGITQPELPTDVDYVRVMSLHKAKGLTADLVIVVGCIEGLIPLVSGISAVERIRSLEEQRRLFYVAITRTRNSLVLSSVTALPWDLSHRMRITARGGNRTHAHTIASRFISELGSLRPRAVLGSSIIRV